MVGTAEAYAAADNVIGEFARKQPVELAGRTPNYHELRGLLAYAYMLGLVDGVAEREAVDEQALTDLRKALA